MEEKHKKVPAFSFLQVPLKSNEIEILLREIVILSNIFLNQHLMQYTNWKGCEKANVISIPVCSTNRDSFMKMNLKTRLIDNLPTYLHHGNEGDVNRIGTAANWIIRKMAHKYDEFLKVCADCGYCIKGASMSDDTALAM